LDRDQKWTLAAKVRKVLFVEKRKKRPPGVMQWDWKLVVPQVRLEIGLYSFFYCPRAEILAWTDVEGGVFLWHQQMFLGKEKGCFLPLAN
jgi:hypothetical protein